ncbi:MAG: HEPN domain-containing protein [Patescibacteria group bacterium]|jgi:HEPN domain-containing protein
MKNCKEEKLTIARQEKRYNWMIMPDLFLATALLLCKNLKPSLNEFSSSSANISKEVGLRSSHPDYEYIIPAVFNFKQGIELYVKALVVINFNKYREKHDFVELFSILKGKYKNDKKKTIFVKKLYEETWPIIEKYYYGRYIPERKDNNTPDKFNEAERYPENNKSYIIPDCFAWVTEDKVGEIEKDIIFLKEKFEQAKRDISGW